MNVDVTMPQLGETVVEGTVTRWLRGVGDPVSAREPLLEISTDKVDTEVPAPAAGRLLEILVPENSTVSVGTKLAVIGPAALGRPRHAHSPRVRRLAAQAGLALDALRGTGLNGRVTPADVVAASRLAEPVAVPVVASPAGTEQVAAPVPDGLAPITARARQADGDRVEPLSGVRALIAERMVRSLRTAAQLTTVVEADVTPVVALRRAAAAGLRERFGLRLTLTAFFARAALEALRAVPVLNASIDPDGRTVTYHAAQHLGIAVDTDRGLMVPIVHDAGDLSLLGLSRRIEDLVARTRSGSISPDELTGGTFTVTNTGSRGALFDTPILVPGQAGILGTGAVVERPAVIRMSDGEPAIAVRSIAHLALTYDHRLVDGADAARFLVAVKERLEAGQFSNELA